MTIRELYQQAINALYEEVAALTDKHGIETELCADGRRFLPTESHDLSLDGNEIVFINQAIALDTDGHQYHLSYFEESGEFESLITALEALADEFGD